MDRTVIGFNTGPVRYACVASRSQGTNSSSRLWFANAINGLYSVSNDGRFCCVNHLNPRPTPVLCVTRALCPCPKLLELEAAYLAKMMRGRNRVGCGHRFCYVNRHHHRVLLSAPLVHRRPHSWPFSGVLPPFPGRGIFSSSRPF